jgi:catechol 2,3-dioxygenase-like lactoylglutathione lyase family enzyme
MGGTQRTSAYPSSRFCRASFVMVLETQGSYELENTMDMPQRLIATITTVGVPVSDQERALGFYTETLGLQKQLDVPLPQFGGRWITVAPPGSVTTIALVPTHKGVPAGVETGIRLASPDAAAAHQQLQDRGVEVGELLRWDGVPPMFAFHDPDGNGLEIIQEVT